MVEASRLLYDKACGGCTCKDIVHPWSDSCITASTMMLTSCIKGSFKFYAMVYAAQILMKGKKLSKAEMMEQLKLYIRSGLFGIVVGTSVVIYNCVVGRLLFSRLYYYNTLLLPSVMSGLAVYLEPTARRIPVTNLFVNLVFEYWVRTLDMKGWLRRSTGRETLIFMIGSAVFFYLLRKERENEKRTPLFWIFTPPRVSKEVGEPVTGINGRSAACPHSGNCVNYILKGSAQLFGVGCAMTILRQIIPRILTPVKAFKSLKLSHLKLGVFFGGYIGIYRLVVCLLCRAHGRDSALYALPAGFLAGAAFRAAPALGIALMPMTTSLQILGSWGYQSGLIPQHWPLVEILFCLCQGLLFHARVLHNEVCPRYVVNLTDTVSNKRTEQIYLKFVQYVNAAM